jgi:hypothetical protein
MMGTSSTTAAEQEAPPSTVAITTISLTEITITISGTCSNLACGYSNCHYFEKLQSPEVAYNLDVVIDESRSRRQLCLPPIFSISSQSFPLVDFNRSYLVREFVKCSFQASREQC